MTKDELRARVANDFTYHSPNPGQAAAYTVLRDQAKAFALLLVEHVPAGRELSTALTKIEEAVMHANAGIARNG